MMQIKPWCERANDSMLYIVAAIMLIGVLCALLSACSVARVSTSEVQDDGSYIERGAWCWGLFTNTVEGFESEWIDKSTSGSLFTDRMGWNSSRNVDAESFAAFLEFAAMMYKAYAAGAGGGVIP